MVHHRRNSAPFVSRYFGTKDRSWLNLQSRYDIETEKDWLGDRLVSKVNEFAAADAEE